MTALGEIYQAIIDYVLRYKQVAIEAGMCELADNLNTVATKKPDTFVSALQLLWIITLIIFDVIDSFFVSVRHNEETKKIKGLKKGKSSV